MSSWTREAAWSGSKSKLQPLYPRRTSAACERWPPLLAGDSIAAFSSTSATLRWPSGRNFTPCRFQLCGGPRRRQRRHSLQGLDFSPLPQAAYAAPQAPAQKALVRGREPAVIVDRASGLPPETLRTRPVPQHHADQQYRQDDERGINVVMMTTSMLTTVTMMVMMMLPQPTKHSRPQPSRGLSKMRPSTFLRHREECSR